MTIDQPINTYSDTAAQKRAISDWIFNIDPMDTPVVARLGMGAVEKFKLVSVNASPYNTKIELLEDTYHPLSTTANNGTTISTSTLSFTVTDGSLFNPGDILWMDSEYMVVADGGVNTTTNVITVDSRSYGGTNATHATDVMIYFVGAARVEGDDADYRGKPSLANVFNYTSIFEEGIKVTGSEERMAQYGKPSGEYAYQMNKIIPNMARSLERAFFHSQQRIGTASQARSMGNIGTYVTSNSSSITTTLTKAALDAVALACFNDGAKPDILIVPPGGADSLRNRLDTSSFVRVTQENTMFGMRPITRVNTQFFENIEVIPSRHCPAKYAWMLDSSKVGLYPYRPWFERNMAISGDSDKGEVVGEFSLLVANGSLGHGYIVTTATSL